MRIFLCCLFFVLVAAPAIWASTCETLAREAEVKHGIPPGLLIAIARAESGRPDGAGPVEAWPWTSNIRGAGRYYETRIEALEHLTRTLDSGEESFDIGCMQINWYWHGDHFESLDALFEPARNVAYAAQFLSELRVEAGSWEAAVRLYHSRDPDRGRSYAARVRDILSNLSVLPEVTLAVAPAPRNYVPSRALSRQDRRFDAQTPLVATLPAATYWMSSALGAGKVPDFVPDARR